jgi:hypothetical protein
MGVDGAVRMRVGLGVVNVPRAARRVLVPVVVIDVPVRVAVHDPVGVGVRVRMRVAGRAGFGPFRHAV